MAESFNSNTNQIYGKEIDSEALGCVIHRIEKLEDQLL